MLDHPDRLAMNEDTGSLGLVVALDTEAKALLGRESRRCSGLGPSSDGFGKTRIFCLRSGPGLDRSGAAARVLLDRNVSALACYGVSGGLAPDLRPGEVVLANAVHSLDGESMRCWYPDQGWTRSVFHRLRRAGMPARLGPVLSSWEMVLSARRKEELYQATRALAVDMESAAVVRAAKEEGIPSLVVRSVCDPAQDSLAGQMVELLTREGTVNWSALFLHLLRRPQLIKDLWRMRLRFRSALSSMRLAFRLQNAA